VLGPRDRLAAVALAASLFALYALGACRTIYVGDSGELVAAVHGLGIPHPTGYPLYVLLGKLWALAVPVGSIALRMSLFSAACAAAACAALFLLLRRARVHPLAAAFAALLLAFSPSFWSQANIQRVYALNALFAALATAAAWRWYATRAPRSLALAFFVCGLGATNHTFMGAYAAALALFAGVADPSLLRRPREVAAAGAAALAGLLPYAYLPLRSRADPRLDWGDPETLERFLDVVLRRDFWERRWLAGPSDLLPIAFDWAASLGSELAWAGTALAALGVLAARGRGWPVALPLLVMLANLISMALHGSRSDLFLWHRYYIPSYLMGALLAGLGCQVLVERLPRWARAVPLLVPTLLFATGFASFDRSRYRVAEAFAQEVLRALPPGAHLAASDDNILFALIYLHLVEGRRPDLDLILQGVGDADLPPLRFDPDQEPLFFTHHPNWSLPGLELAPVGLAFRVWRTGRPLPEPVLPAEPLAGEDDPAVPKDYLTRNLIGHFHYMLGVTFERRDWLRARRELEAAARAAPANDVLFYNLGLIFARNGLLDDALRAFERAHAINLRHLPSGSRPRASDRIGELRAERERLAAIEATLEGDATLAEIDPRSAAWHLRLAELLAARGEQTAARGHELRAEERSAGGP
jgi:tetratricopeptide (TPR) repeat protein